ncbi:hypothetical protein GGR58DRAFT_237742 [Xylaria digitata]|nr:hypothetical protein GGR58DRAFT_237742 [Xylaria digitata]
MATHPDPAGGGSNGYTNGYTNGGPDEAAHLSDEEGEDDLTCDCCAEVKPLYELPCEHEFCHECVIMLFRVAIQQNRFPATCCQPLPTDLWITLLPEDLARIFRRKEEESCTHNPTRCHDSECDAFIPPRRILQGVRNCPKCGQNTCEACKQAAHDGPCQDTESRGRFVEWAEDLGWKRCPACGYIIERTDGCNHMA